MLHVGARCRGAVVAGAILGGAMVAFNARAGEPAVIDRSLTVATNLPCVGLPSAVDPCLAKPLGGMDEGWPAVSAEAVAYLAGQGIRCLGTDGPTLGGVDPEVAREVDWLAGSKGLVVVEMLTGLEAIAGRDAFFVFAPIPIKIAATHGGYGRALAPVAAGAGTAP